MALGWDWQQQQQDRQQLRAGAESKGAGGPRRGPWPRPRPRRGPQTLPSRLARQGAAGAPGASLWRGGTFPTGSDPAPTWGTGAPRARVTGKPFRVCAGGGGWGVGEEKKRGGFARSLCGPLPPGRHPPPSPLRTAAPGGGDPEGPARSHGLGFLEPPGRPGGCRQWGRTTPAGAAALRPAPRQRREQRARRPESRKRGPRAPLCEGRGRGGGSRWLRTPPAPACPWGARSAAPSPGLEGRVSTPHAPCLPSPPHPPRHFALALSPPPAFNFLFFPRRGPPLLGSLLPRSQISAHLPPPRPRRS